MRSLPWISTSQQEVAKPLGVDRTTMVALLDSLESKGIIVRHPLHHDRRRNVVELTDIGRAFFERAQQVERDTENIYIACPSPQGNNNFETRYTSLLPGGPHPTHDRPYAIDGGRWI